MELYFYLLPFALLLGIFTSYGDIKYSKIKNYILYYSFFSMVIINIVFAFLIRDVIYLYSEYYFQYFLNVFLIFLIGIMLWLSGFWNAADSKLITVFSIAITPGVINYNFSNLYIVNFFYNIIMVNLLFLLFRLFRDGLFNSFSNIKQNLMYFKKTSLLEQVILFITMYSFGIISYFFSFISNTIDRFYIVVLFMMVMMSFFKKLKYWSLILFVFFMINTFYNFHNLLKMSYWYNIIVFFLMINILKFVFEIISLANIVPIKFKDLKEKMFIVQDLKCDTTEGKNSKSIVSLIGYDQSIGLTKENILKLNEISKTFKKKEILVSKKDIFAPYVFIGFILTILIHTNIISYIKLIFFS